MEAPKIKDLQQEEKPREKMVRFGASNLTNVELVSIILGSGGKENSVIETSRNILRETAGLKGLIDIDIDKLMNQKYIGLAKATKLKALGEISLRISNERSINGLKIKDPKDVYHLLNKDLFGKKKEMLYLISLDTRNRLISKDIITMGTINETLVHPREIFIKALEKNAVYIIIAHNHPSQDTQPSSHDLIVTERIANVGKSLGIPLLDHVIMSDSNYTSLKKDYGGDLSNLSKERR